MEEKKIALCLLSDNGYLDYTSTLVYSFIENNKWFNGDIVIICDDSEFKFTEDNLAGMKKLYENIILRVVEREKYKELRDLYADKVLKPSYINCFYKYEIFRMPEYSKVLFLDSDMCVMKDIHELFEVEAPISFCHDGIPSEGTYGGINAGLILVNNDVLDKHFYERIIKYTKQIDFTKEVNGHKVGKFAEQDIFNLYFKNKKVNYLDDKYNTPNAGGYVDVVERTEKASIVHYWSKPLNKDNLYFYTTKESRIWYEYNRIAIAKIANRNLDFPLAGNLKYCLIGQPHESPFHINQISDYKWLKDKEFIDFRKFNLEFYDGYRFNDHHITTRSFYHMIIPELARELNFPFNKKDFELVHFTDEEGRFDLSYLKPKNDSKYLIEINKEQVLYGNFQEALCPGTIGTEGYWGTNYHKLFSGYHKCSRILNSNPVINKTILVCGDSHMIPVIPIMAYYYREVVLLDNRKDGASYNEYFGGRYFDDVLVEYWDPERDILLESLH